MADLRNRFENTKDKVVGKTKEVAEKATGSKVTEIKGKLQSKKADLKEKFSDSKEKIAKKLNDRL